MDTTQDHAMRDRIASSRGYLRPDVWFTGMNRARTRQLVTGEVLVT
jgi:hypothetical protein